MKYPLQLTIPEHYFKQKLEEFLLEDAPQGDFTTVGIFDEARIVVAKIQAQENLVFAGEPVIKNFFDDSFKIHMNCTDGQIVKEGEIIAEIKGNVETILVTERVLLNLLQRLCGIATETRKYVEIATPYNVKILDTRKTTPGLRFFEKYAVAVAGGFSHRLNLSTGILIKDNHIKAAGGITNAVNKIRSKNYGLPIEVEVENIDEIIEALECNTQNLLLDNFSPAETHHAVKQIRQLSKGKDIFIESSGGINLDTIGDYVKTGIDAASVGALTHSVKCSNIHMEFYNA